MDANAYSALASMATTVVIVTIDAIVDSATAPETDASAFPERLANTHAFAPVGIADSKVTIATSVGGRWKRRAASTKAMNGITASLRELITAITPIAASRNSTGL